MAEEGTEVKKPAFVRPEISFHEANWATLSVLEKLMRRFEENGYGGAVSVDEILGEVTRHYLHLASIAGVQDLDAVENSLLNLAAACVRGVTSKRSETLEE